MTYVIQISVKYVFHKNYEAHKLLKDILYILGGGDHELTIFSCLAAINEASPG